MGITHKTRYGLSIEDTGIEFVDIAGRAAFLELLSRANSVTINGGSGIRYGKDEHARFGIYERDPQKVVVRCYSCDLDFEEKECGKRLFQKMMDDSF